MKWQTLAAMVLTGTALIGCDERPVQRVESPRMDDPSAYRPMVQPKPDAPAGYNYGQPPVMPGTPVVTGLKNEESFLAAYNQRRPRIMVFVNRTIQGDALPKEGMEELLRVETKQSASGAVAVTNNDTVTGSGQSTSAGPGGSSASNTNINRSTGNSFTSGGPAEYSRTTSVKKAADKTDWIGATSDDYSMIEMSLVQYFNDSGRVQIKDSETVRANLDREQVLRIENGDPAANRLLAVQFQQDVLIRVTARPTTQSLNGAGVRLIAKSVSTTDGRILGTAAVDMPPQLSKTNINIYTRYLTEELMGQMAKMWSLPPEYDPIEVRIYKFSPDNAGQLKTWMTKAPGVTRVDVVSATAGTSTGYGVFTVGFAGAPIDFYTELKDGIGLSSGLKAVDMSSKTISLEITGPMNLVTTTRHVDTTTTIETRTTEERRVEPILPMTQPR